MNRGLTLFVVLVWGRRHRRSGRIERWGGHRVNARRRGSKPRGHGTIIGTPGGIEGISVRAGITAFKGLLKSLGNVLSAVKPLKEGTEKTSGGSGTEKTEKYVTSPAVVGLQDG